MLTLLPLQPEASPGPILRPTTPTAQGDVNPTAATRFADTFSAHAQNNPSAGAGVTQKSSDIGGPDATEEVDMADSASQDELDLHSATVAPDQDASDTGRVMPQAGNPLPVSANIPVVAQTTANASHPAGEDSSLMQRSTSDHVTQSPMARTTPEAALMAGRTEGVQHVQVSSARKTQSPVLPVNASKRPGGVASESETAGLRAETTQDKRPDTKASGTEKATAITSLVQTKPQDPGTTSLRWNTQNTPAHVTGNSAQARPGLAGATDAAAIADSTRLSSHADERTGTGMQPVVGAHHKQTPGQLSQAQQQTIPPTLPPRKLSGGGTADGNAGRYEGHLASVRTLDKADNLRHATGTSTVQNPMAAAVAARVSATATGPSGRSNPAAMNTQQSLSVRAGSSAGQRLDNAREQVLEPARSAGVRVQDPIATYETSQPAKVEAERLELPTTQRVSGERRLADTTVAESGREQLQRQINEQLVARLSGRQLRSEQITLQLNPRSLGSLVVDIDVRHNDMAQQAQEVRVNIYAREAATRELMDQSMPRLRSLLTDNGMDVKDLQITDFNSRNGAGAEHKQQSEKSWSQRQGTQEPPASGSAEDLEPSQVVSSDHLIEAFV